MDGRTFIKHLMDGNHHIPFYGMGVTPGYNFELGTRQELHERVGIGHEAIVKRLKKHLNLERG